MPNQIDRRKLLQWAAPTMSVILAASALPRASAYHPYGADAWPECCPGQDEPQPLSKREEAYFHNVPWHVRNRHSKRFGTAMPDKIGQRYR